MSFALSVTFSLAFFAASAASSIFSSGQTVDLLCA
jgi:hypothetical protein